MNRQPFRVLIPFNTDTLPYGLERSVIEIFALLRPDVSATFLVSQNTSEWDCSVLRELRRREMTVGYFSDTTDWPRVDRPRSFPHLVRMLKAFCVGNFDVLRHASAGDALYLPSVSYGYFALATILLYRLQGKRVLHHFHEIGSQSRRQLDWFNALVTDHIHNTAYGLRTAAASNPAILKRRNHVIPLPVELVTSPDSPEMREAFSGRRNIVYAGQLSLTKGLDILLDAIEIVVSTHPDVRLHLLGTPQGADVLKTRLENSPGYVRCWGFREDISAFFRNAFLVVQSTPPSRCQESFGRTVVEAAMSGTPVVCFASGALTELVADGVTGTICREETAICLANAVIAYLDNRAVREVHAANAKNRKTFSPDAVRQAWLRCLGSNPGPEEQPRQ